ncbi:ATP-binding cassette domain-containing protein [Corynebacterium canis]|uniref:ATP-binding cassette domain-containing protein n=1 Tax=Corynebacterium canis TaxID=679663 RepID=A0A5C5UJL9_9CORY|nr:ATP-binding cassette domain-containing protein [Corynebacterium canis]TWT25555.1 ATP-binding cassette domain-containing protein [Corynebacterium canis]WJY74087.1 Putative HMP/thiamine import ATP-binding protein YkoD [Corynebacterium canis]
MRVDKETETIAAQAVSIETATGAQIVSNVSLRLGVGEGCLLVGDSGCGKSTFLAACAGVIAETHPDLRVLGELRVLDHAEIEYPLHAGIGYVAQDPDAYVLMPTVWEEVAFPLENLGLPYAEVVRRTERCLAEFALEHLASASPWQLSGGQRQRLAMACIWVAEPKLYLLDEPTAHLDAAWGRRLLENLNERVAGGEISMLMVTHKQHTESDGSASVFRLSPQHPSTIAAEPLALGFTIESGYDIELDQLVSRKNLVGLPAVSATLKAGEITVIRGENGSGKSSLLRVLAGAARPHSGAVRGPGQLLGRTAWCRQNPELQFGDVTVADTIQRASTATVRREAWSQAEIQHLRAALKLDHIEECASVFTLSGGEQQRLAVLAATLRAAPIMLFDEPTANQDPVTKTLVARCLRALADAGATVIWVCHDEQLAAEYADATIDLGRARTEEPAPAAARTERAERHSQQALHPVAIQLCVFALIVASFAIESAGVLLGLLAVAVAILVALTWKSPRELATKLQVILAVGVVFSLVGARSSLAGEMWNPYSIIVAGASHGMALAHCVAWALIGGTVTNARRVLESASQSFRFNDNFVVVPMTGMSILHYVRHQWREILDTLLVNEARGTGIWRRATRRVRVAVRVVLPLLVATIRFAERTSVTLLSRGYPAPNPRTINQRYRWRWRDSVSVFCVTLGVIAVSVLA